MLIKYFLKKEQNKMINTLNLMRDFCYYYFDSTFLLSASNCIQKEITDLIDAYNQSSDIDYCCNIIQAFPQNIIRLWDQFKDDLSIYTQISIYLLYPIYNIISFIEQHHMTSSENIFNFKSECENLRATYDELIKKYISDTNSLDSNVKESCYLLTQSFPEYRSAKRGNPILRTISRVGGSFLGGYLSASLTDNLDACINFGTLLGDSFESIVDTFTSGKRQDKISSYESFLNDILTGVEMANNELASELYDIRSDCNDFIIELHKIIINYLIRIIKMLEHLIKL